uniref:MFS general substrate transporter n=1 Tax=Mycena chlorophos TaxID=658473 RepID=A0ABQ0LLW7_MYCCL|nr:predicted protein [Mycena chlorophos]
MSENQEQQPTTPVAQGAAPGTFPEGGLRAWATVVGAFVVQFSSFGYWSAFGVYQDYYTRIYLTHSPPSSISWIGSIGTFIVVSGGLISGRLYDRGYFYFLLYGGSLLFCFSIFMLSLCRPEQYYQVFLAQGLGSGFGAATLYVPTIAVVSQYFQKRRALAMSIVASGSALGAVVFPILLNNTLNSHLGFASAVRITGGVITALLLGACPLLKPRIPPASNHPPFISSIQRFSKDLPYVLATAGTGLFTIGLYYPI